MTAVLVLGRGAGTLPLMCDIDSVSIIIIRLHDAERPSQNKCEENKEYCILTNLSGNVASSSNLK